MRKKNDFLLNVFKTETVRKRKRFRSLKKKFYFFFLFPFFYDKYLKNRIEEKISKRFFALLFSPATVFSHGFYSITEYIFFLSFRCRGSNIREGGGELKSFWKWMKWKNHYRTFIFHIHIKFFSGGGGIHEGKKKRIWLW